MAEKNGDGPPPSLATPEYPRFKEPVRKIPQHDLLNLREFVMRVVVGGEPAYKAGKMIGWSATKTRQVVGSVEYLDLRNEIVAEYSESKEQFFRQVTDIYHDTVFTAAVRLQKSVYDPETDLGEVRKIHDATADRIGLRAPQKVDNTIRVELGQDTIDMLGKMSLDMEKLKGFDFDKEFSFALSRPKAGIEDTRSRVGTATKEDEQGE